MSEISAEEWKQTTISKSDAHFLRATQNEKIAEDIRRMEMIPVAVRREMEEYQRVADSASNEIDLYTNRKQTSIGTLLLEAALLSGCGVLMVRGYRTSEPMRSWLPDSVKSPRLRRLGNPYSTAGAFAGFSTLVYVPSDVKTYLKAKADEQALKSTRHNALQHRLRIFNEAVAARQVGMDAESKKQ